jgi:23S rRNA (uracil1939-C5)-methyltransferase
MKRKAQLQSATVSGLSGKGLARLVLDQGSRQGLDLWGPLPGEQVDVQLGQRKNVWLQEVRSVHPERREPPCLHTGPCGGCTVQHLGYAAQLRLKSQRLYTRLAQVAPTCIVDPPQGSPQQFHYRTKVEFSFLGEHLGYHRRGCFDKAVGVQLCWIAPPAHRELLEVTRSWQHTHSLQGWAPRQQSGDLRYLLVRQSNPGNDWLAVLVTRTGLEPAVVQQWAFQVAGLSLSPRGLLWVEQSSPAAAIVPDRQHLLFGADDVRQPLGDLQFRLGWRSFFQSNPPAYKRMLDTLKGWLAPLHPRRVLDLYCGIGSIGLYVTEPGMQLVGVENVPEAVADARRCAADFGREAEYTAVAAEAWQDWNCDVALVDPPRAGCHPDLVQSLARHGPRDVFYISCNPEKLFAELAVLSPAYQVVRAVACDFFPQTAHMELLCWLRRP